MLIPHGGRWRLLDRVLSLDETGVVGEGDFTVEDCAGHFPGDPIVPGVLLLEGLAQTMLVLHQQVAQGKPLLAGADRVRFKAAVRPPATVRFEVVPTVHREGRLRAHATASCGGVVVCTAVLTGVLT